MHNLISKDTFTKIFGLDKKFNKLGKWHFQKDTLNNTTFVNNYINIFTGFLGNCNFNKNLVKIGFVKQEIFSNGFYFCQEYRFYIADEYISFVQNIFDLIESEDIDQTHLAFQLFQNIKLYKLKKDGKASNKS